MTKKFVHDRKDHTNEHERLNLTAVGVNVTESLE